MKIYSDRRLEPCFIILYFVVVVFSSYIVSPLLLHLTSSQIFGNLMIPVEASRINHVTIFQEKNNKEHGLFKKIPSLFWLLIELRRLQSKNSWWNLWCIAVCLAGKTRFFFHTRLISIFKFQTIAMVTETN